ncbi:Aste57867_18784 [Aphanomyces stellatus]|uniref:Aste57867_18784 protein n=1 Tax=Aphanomyces stellatus TaxID=120398 RepID=A0A485LB18_9STRA|nr:hypothetical protein As57867_018720 [Aphanomyces stellatus]VFT95518.1 Aste57867_18784 [Aphanomyces stellatus]
MRNNTEQIPVAIAESLSTPTNEFHNLPQAELRMSHIAMAIPVADRRCVRPASMDGFHHRWPCRRMAYLQMVYFLATYVVFAPSIIPSVVAWLSGLVGIYGTRANVEVSHIRAIAIFGATNTCLCLYFLVYLAVTSVSAATGVGSATFDAFFLALINAPVLIYAASVAHVYHRELLARLQAGVTLVQTVPAAVVEAAPFVTVV